MTPLSVQSHPLEKVIGADPKVGELLEVEVQVVPPKDESRFGHRVRELRHLALASVVELGAVAVA